MQQDLIGISHPELVTALAKTGEAIIANLTPEAAHNWHMVTGLSGEVGELHAALSNSDPINTLEELGDIEFYFEGLCQGAGVPRPTDVVSLHISTSLLSVVQLYQATGEIVDVVKKQAIYNQPLNTDLLQSHLRMFTAIMDAIYRSTQITREQALEHNKRKLVVRYQGLRYSDQAARERVDKQ